MFDSGILMELQEIYWDELFGIVVVAADVEISRNVSQVMVGEDWEVLL